MLSTDQMFNLINCLDKKILVVDDNLSSVVLITEMLSKTKFQILKTQDCIEALRICDQEEISAVFIDLILNGYMQGLNFIKILRFFHKNIPIIAYTACVDDYNRKKCFAYGCNYFLEKPLHYDQLIICLYDQLVPKKSDDQTNSPGIYKNLN